MARGISNKITYQILKMLTNPTKRNHDNKDHNRTLISDNESLLNKYIEYCNKLYKYPTA